jgi:hypothetical protein
MIEVEIFIFDLKKVGCIEGKMIRDGNKTTPRLDLHKKVITESAL